MRHWILVMLLILPGCLDNATTDEASSSRVEPPARKAIVQDPQWAIDAIFAGEDAASQDWIPQHDHGDRALHEALSTSNFEVLGWDPLATDLYGTAAGTYYCGEVARYPERTLAVAAAFGTATAIIVIDVTDPTQPAKVGELNLPNTHIYDATITPDGDHALLATGYLPGGTGTVVEAEASASEGLTEQGAPVQASWTDPCGNTTVGPAFAPEDNAPFGSGLVLVDLADPRAPRIADYAPQPIFGAHSVSAEDVDGTTWIAASTTNLVYSASYFTFWTIESVAGLDKLVPQGAWSSHYVHPGTGRLDEPATNIGFVNGHVDATMQVHPLTGDLLAYLANWDGGMVIVRLDGGGQVTYQGGWGEWQPERGQQMTGQIHSVVPQAELIDGRHITITGQEILGRPADRATGEIVLVDTTDPTAPEPVARWTLPIDVRWGGLLGGGSFSTHYMVLVNGTLFTSVYHGGVWAADASPEHWPELPSSGVFIPANEPPTPPVATVTSPLVQQVMDLPGGDLLVFDANSGAYTVRFHPDDTSVPLASPWVQDAWI